MATLNEVEIYTDGGCEPNPGPGGYAAVLVHPKKRLEISGGFRLTTNNRMELFAAIAGLEMLKQPCKVILYSDSQYLVEAMSKGWVKGWQRKRWWHSQTRPVPNRDLWERLLGLCGSHDVEFRWIKGHAGHVENERCDQLSGQALKQPHLPYDQNYETREESRTLRPDLQEGDPCRKCGNLVVKIPGKRKPGRAYYFEFHLFCSVCNTTYLVESARKAIQQTPSLI